MLPARSFSILQRQQNNKVTEIIGNCPNNVWLLLCVSRLQQELMTRDGRTNRANKIAQFTFELSSLQQKPNRFSVSSRETHRTLKLHRKLPLRDFEAFSFFYFSRRKTFSATWSKDSVFDKKSHGELIWKGSKNKVIIIPPQFDVNSSGCDDQPTPDQRNPFSVLFNFVIFRSRNLGSASNFDGKTFTTILIASWSDSFLFPTLNPIPLMLKLLRSLR